jgi:hypothetical protein
MNIDQRIKSFASLGTYLRNMPAHDLQTLTDSTRNQNPWFTPSSVQRSLGAIGEILTEDSLTNWLKNYEFSTTPAKVALVLAGNIPAVGFHDLLCVLISGNNAVVKLSSKDQILIEFLLEKLYDLEPAFRDKVEIVDRLVVFDAVIATGSDNTSRYFEYYFGKYPHIIRKNRSSVAILTSTETTEELSDLSDDVFSYFGLGCRNVSKIFIPEDFSFDRLFKSWDRFSEIIHHHKYCNNYDYQKSILLVNREKFLDNGFVILQQSDKIVSPISVVYYEFYKNNEELKSRLDGVREKIQVIVGKHPYAKIPFGKAQCPSVNDYADNVDTMHFLTGLKIERLQEG